MKLLDLAPLLGAIFNFGLAVFVLANDRRSKINQVFFFWLLCVATWNACTFALFRIPESDKPEAMRWAIVLQYAVIFIPVSMLHLSLLLAEVKPGRIIALLYALHAVLALTNALGWFISDVQFVGYAWYSKAGPAFYVYSCAFVQTGVAIYILLKKRAALPTLQKARLNALIAAQVLLAVLGSNDLLPIIGIPEYPVIHVAIFPYGSMAAVFYGIIVGYAVLQHQLLDVHVALGRNTALIVRFAFLLAIGLALQLTITLVAPSHFTPVSFTSSMVVLAVSTVLATILFPRLLGSTVERLDRKVQGDRFEAQDRVRSFVESMVWYDDLDVLLDELHTILVRTLGTTSYKIILRDEVLHMFTLHRSFPADDETTLPEIKINSPIFQYFEWSKSEYLALNAKYAWPAESNMGRLARRQFAPSGAEFVFPLTSQNEPFGLLLVGARTSGAEYSGTDIAMLVGLVKNLSLMVNQVRLKTQIRQNQDFELLGKMSRGMAHDLNNLLTPVTTLLQLSTESGPGATLGDELLPVAMRNVKTMRAYIRESLFFSENLRPQVQLASLDDVIGEAVATARSSRDKPGEILVEAVPMEIEMDAVLIQRLIVNLISNAIDASAPGGFLEVRLERLPRSEVARDWVRLRVVDHGEGISKENLSRVQTPYFTTKNRGDSNRGFGLGLAICRKIVNLHGGNLSIASQLKKGTTVQVDLPTRQTAPTMPQVPLPA
jgi:signal transduction histidine kinase